MIVIITTGIWSIYSCHGFLVTSKGIVSNLLMLFFRNRMCDSFLSNKTIVFPLPNNPIKNENNAKATIPPKKINIKYLGIPVRNKQVKRRVRIMQITVV